MFCESCAKLRNVGSALRAAGQGAAQGCRYDKCVACCDSFCAKPEKPHPRRICPRGRVLGAGVRHFCHFLHKRAQRGREVAPGRMAPCTACPLAWFLD